MENKKSPHPDWALKEKRPGTELRNINGKYYLYQISSAYDLYCHPKNKTKNRKKSVEFKRHFFANFQIEQGSNNLALNEDTCYYKKQKMLQLLLEPLQKN